jgi:hypothetical protein
VELATLDAAPPCCAVRFSHVENKPRVRHVRLRVTWDGRQEPSIDRRWLPFFGAGTLYNRDGREYLVKGFPIHRFAKDRVPGLLFRCRSSSRRDSSSSASARFDSGVQWRLRHHPLTPANPPAISMPRTAIILPELGQDLRSSTPARLRRR